MDIEQGTSTGEAECDGCSVGIEAGHRSARIARPLRADDALAVLQRPLRPVVPQWL